MGCSPYFAATGVHPLLPLDIAEVTYLLPSPTAPLSMTDLIAARAVTLQKRHAHLMALHAKVMSSRVQAAVRFEQEHVVTIRDFNFKHGDLVLIRNTAIEKALNRKMRARYLGPLVVLARNKGGTYIICELNGSVFDRPVAAFCVIPYFARKSLLLPDLDKFIDISTEHLRSMEKSTTSGPDDEDAEDMGAGDDDGSNDESTSSTDDDAN